MDGFRWQWIRCTWAERAHPASLGRRPHELVMYKMCLVTGSNLFFSTSQADLWRARGQCECWYVSCLTALLFVWTIGIEIHLVVVFVQIPCCCKGHIFIFITYLRGKVGCERRGVFGLGGPWHMSFVVLSALNFSRVTYSSFGRSVGTGRISEPSNVLCSYRWNQPAPWPPRQSALGPCSSSAKCPSPGYTGGVVGSFSIDPMFMDVAECIWVKLCWYKAFGPWLSYANFDDHVSSTSVSSTGVRHTRRHRTGETFSLCSSSFACKYGSDVIVIEGGDDNSNDRSRRVWGCCGLWCWPCSCSSGASGTSQFSIHLLTRSVQHCFVVDGEMDLFVYDVAEVKTIIPADWIGLPIRVLWRDFHSACERTPNACPSATLESFGCFNPVTPSMYCPLPSNAAVVVWGPLDFRT